MDCDSFRDICRLHIQDLTADCFRGDLETLSKAHELLLMSVLKQTLVPCKTVMAAGFRKAFPKTTPEEAEAAGSVVKQMVRMLVYKTGSKTTGQNWQQSHTLPDWWL